MYGNGYAQADTSFSRRRNVENRGKKEGKERTVLAYSSTEDSAEDAWRYFAGERRAVNAGKYDTGEYRAVNMGGYFEEEKQRAHSKELRRRELAQNRMRLAGSGKKRARGARAAGQDSHGAGGARKNRSGLRRRRVRRAVLGAAAVLAVFAAFGLTRGRQAGETISERVRIWEHSGGRGTDTAGRGADDWNVDIAGCGAEEGQEADVLMLVNKDYALPDGYRPRLHWLQNKSCAVAEEMYPALKQMLTEGSEEGLQFVVASGYRDSELQEKLLEEDIKASMESEGLTWQQAYDKETRETMPPGHSEHETGLAADIVSLDYQILDAQQEDTPECRWLQENCSRYGFILRYPRGKEDITQVDYESWHFRYVGEEAAQEIMSRGITLEEYLGKD